MKQIRSYILSILIALGTGGLSAFLTRNSMNIYEELATPPLSPPSILFPIVWTVLYVLMGVSAALIYNTPVPEGSNQKEKALFTYALSLFVNFSWSLFFFGERAFLFSFFWLLLLWVLVLKTILQYREINPTAALLQIPYLLWITFAGYLNLGIYLLNR